MRSGQILLCVCPAHGSLGCAPAGLAGARPGLLVLSLGDSYTVPRVPGGRGASAADTSLHQPSNCPPLPSEPVVLLGTKWPLGPAYSLWLLLPPGPSSLAGARFPRLRPKETCSSLASGLSSGCASAAARSGTWLSVVPNAVRWAQACLSLHIPGRL